MDFGRPFKKMDFFLRGKPSAGDLSNHFNSFQLFIKIAFSADKIVISQSKSEVRGSSIFVETEAFVFAGHMIFFCISNTLESNGGTFSNVHSTFLRFFCAKTRDFEQNITDFLLEISNIKLEISHILLENTNISLDISYFLEENSYISIKSTIISLEISNLYFALNVEYFVRNLEHFNYMFSFIFTQWILSLILRFKFLFIFCFKFFACFLFMFFNFYIFALLSALLRAFSSFCARRVFSSPVTCYIILYYKSKYQASFLLSTC